MDTTHLHASCQLDLLECICCGYPSHGLRQTWAAEGKKCYACGGENHLAAVCVKGSRAKVNAQNKKRVINAVMATTSDEAQSSDSASADTDLSTIAAVDGFG
ncbi:hypothetical protein TTRE_0000859501 [Trichuris trichiura]|uniref:CCHC-type domain-containing protein n=1 Tax=Trichuris trichiura TaxID=36087 RepID=A0A077ZIM4_TRITR|nr:hypothetical protein TTRE_0000859501 [Trichuris trichiura]